jgi:diguanylate cyclase (GGDEF)-like protein/putative nucleotidyltransferase with HDIG domain
MKNTESVKKAISIRISIIILFTVLMMTTVASVSIMLFSNWLSSTDENIKIIASNINDEIYNQVIDFIHNPQHINEANYELIKKGIVDMKDERERDAFLLNILKSHSGELLHGVSFATETGEYYGVRKNEDGELYFVKSGSETGGKFWYYKVKDDFKSGEVFLKGSIYDPRTRAWYQAAKESGKSTYSEVYKHISEEDINVSSTTPIYDNNGKLYGVIATHITLSIIDDYLKNIVENKNSIAVIVEKGTGNLISNSMGLNNYEFIENDEVKRFHIEDTNNNALIEAYENYESTGNKSIKINGDKENYYVNIEEYHSEGLDWVFITAMSDETFTKGIYASSIMAVILILCALILSFVIYMKFTNKFFMPINDLIETTEMFAKGEFLKRATVFRNDELGTITKSFNKMAETMHLLVNNLEEKVQERTLELDKTNSELRDNVEQIKYLSYHDSLTGLYNRLYFEENLINVDKDENLPISIIFGDVNGLKLTNDIFGHTTGDELLNKSAEILKKTCRSMDVVARMGGDEFAVILPKTDEHAVKKIIERVKSELSKDHIGAIKCSMSLGSCTKSSEDQDIVGIMGFAEEMMYKDKTINRDNVNSELINTIIKTLHSNYPREKVHSENVSKLSSDLALAMELPENEVHMVKEAGFLHDIGKIAVKDEIINNKYLLNTNESKEIKQHSLAGYRILNLFEETKDLAEAVISHHEKWNGTGYPNGLKGEEIPAMARIISIAETYDVFTNPIYNISMTKGEALLEIKKYSGINYDPNITEIFIKMMTEKPNQ